MKPQLPAFTTANAPTTSVPPGSFAVLLPELTLSLPRLPPAVSAGRHGKKVIIVDFSCPYETLVDMATVVESVLTLGHYKPREQS